MSQSSSRSTWIFEGQVRELQESWYAQSNVATSPPSPRVDPKAHSSEGNSENMGDSARADYFGAGKRQVELIDNDAQVSMMHNDYPAVQSSQDVELDVFENAAENAELLLGEAVEPQNADAVKVPTAGQAKSRQVNVDQQQSLHDGEDTAAAESSRDGMDPTENGGSGENEQPIREVNSTDRPARAQEEELLEVSGAEEGCLGGKFNEAAAESGVEVPAAADLQSAELAGDNPNEIREGRPEGSTEVHTDGRSDPRALFDDDLNLIPLDQAPMGLLNNFEVEGRRIIRFYEATSYIRGLFPSNDYTGRWYLLSFQQDERADNPAGEVLEEQQHDQGAAIVEEAQGIRVQQDEAAAVIHELGAVGAQNGEGVAVMDEPHANDGEPQPGANAVQQQEAHHAEDPVVANVGGGQPEY